MKLPSFVWSVAGWMLSDNPATFPIRGSIFKQSFTFIRKKASLLLLFIEEVMCCICNMSYLYRVNSQNAELLPYTLQYLVTGTESKSVDEPVWNAKQYCSTLSSYSQSDSSATDNLKETKDRISAAQPWNSKNLNSLLTNANICFSSVLLLNYLHTTLF